MDVLFLILLVLAAACFGAAAAGRAGGRVNLVALGLFLWVLVPLIQAVQGIAA